MKVLVKRDSRYPLSVKRIKILAKKILVKKGVRDKCELSVLFVGRRKARSLNQQYRKMDYIPEVLAFPMDDVGPDDVLRLGDVMICFPLARDQAMKRERMVHEVVTELLEHGIGNLLKTG